MNETPAAGWLVMLQRQIFANPFTHESKHMELSYPERVSRLNKHIGRGTLIRNKFSRTDEDGRQTVCLLAALAPEVITLEEPGLCPADVMPDWLAHLTPSIDDLGTYDMWEGTIRRYAKLAGDWHLLDVQAWARLSIKAIRICLGECRKRTPSKLWEAIDNVWEREAAGEAVPDFERLRLQDQVRDEVGKYHRHAVRPQSPLDLKTRTSLLLLLRSNAGRGPSLDRSWRMVRLSHRNMMASVDRMTNLLLDAIQKEIDAALAETT